MKKRESFNKKNGRERGMPILTMEKITAAVDDFSEVLFIIPFRKIFIYKNFLIKFIYYI